MDDEFDTELLPYVLQAISQKPNMCDTFENLHKELKAALSSETLDNHYGTFKKDLERAVDFGKSLGILTITNQIVRVPFTLRGNKAPSIARKIEEEEESAAQSRSKPVVLRSAKSFNRSRATIRRLQLRPKRRR